MCKYLQFYVCNNFWNYLRFSLKRSGKLVKTTNCWVRKLKELNMCFKILLKKNIGKQYFSINQGKKESFYVYNKQFVDLLSKPKPQNTLIGSPKIMLKAMIQH